MSAAVSLSGSSGASDDPRPAPGDGVSARAPHLARLLRAAQGGSASDAERAPVAQRPAAPARAVSLHIARLSLVGLPYSASQSRSIGAAAERELARLIGASAPSAWAGGAVPAVAAVPLRLATGWSPERVGRALGAQVFAAVGEFCSPAPGDMGVLP